MTQSSPITFCISTYNNLEYLKLAVESVREHSYFKDAPFIIHAENCIDGTDIWLKDNMNRYQLEVYIEHNKVPLGIGGGMNFCADKVRTEYIMFLHSDFYVSKNWDIECLKVMEEYPEGKLWVFSQRVQPNIFKEESRHGTLIVPTDEFGSYYYDFNKSFFLEYAKELSNINDFRIPLGEGVSGLISKKDWDYIGGNDSRFAPSSWEDKDLFLRMLMEDYKFILISKSVVWHFGARGSHRLEENNGRSSQRQLECEQRNIRKWLDKWGRMPEIDEYGMIKRFYKR